MYLAIAAAIDRAMDEGSLREGEGLPPHRELAERLGVALGTVTRAYAEAARVGLVRARGRRGTSVSSRDRRGSSAVASLGRRSEGLIDLGVNYPSPEDDPDPAQALQTAAKSLDRRKLLRYAPPEGLPRHRAAFAAFLARTGVSVAPEQLVLCAGGQHAISLVFSSQLHPGDTLAIEALSFPGAIAAARSRNLRLLPVPFDGEGPSLGALDRACAATRVAAFYCIPSIQNPTAGSMSEQRKKELAALARKRDFVIIEDEIHRPFLQSPGSSFVGLAPERSFLLASTSKCVAGGLRTGAVVAPESSVDGLAEAVLDSMWCVSPLNFELLSLWLEDGTVDRVIERRRASGRERRDMADRILAGHVRRAPTGTESAPFLWLELLSIPRADFVKKAAEEGVAISPSDMFAVDSIPPEAVRISLSGAASSEKLEVALSRLARIMA